MAAVFAAAMLVPLGPQGAAASSPGSGASYRIEWSGAQCPATPLGHVSTYQTADGKVTACLDVPDVPGGTYHLFLSQYLYQKVSPVLPPAITGASPVVTMTASPSSVRPGQAITLTGTLRRAYRVKNNFAWFCWGGCPGGLSYSEVPLTWRSPRTFTATLTAPEAPWLDLSTGRVVSPATGDYEIGVQCLENVHECGLGAAEGEAVVRLEASAPYTCRTVPGCAHLAVTPAVASPGQVVEVTGYAPVAQTSAGGQVFAGDIDGEKGGPARWGVSFSASSQVVEGARSVQVDMGGAAIRVVPAPTFSALGYIAPLHQEVAGEPPVSANPFASSTVAWCGLNNVVEQGPGGTVRVPTAAAVEAIARTGQFAKSAFDRCITVAVGTPSAGAPGAVFAAFWVDQLDASDLVALYADDGGEAWKFVPRPPGSSLVGFGGFRYGPLGQVEALFGPSWGGTAPQVEETFDGGAHWSLGTLACPEAGPCIALGAANVTGCDRAMGYQSLLRSADGGRRWVPVPVAAGALPTCSVSEVVDLTRTEVLLVGATGFIGYAGAYPLLLSRDGGTKWQVVSLPALPGQYGIEWEQPSPDLVVRPDGGIVYVGPQSWYLLAPRASKWCPVAGVPSGSAGALEGLPPSLTVIGTELWWLDLGSTTSISAHHVSDSSLTCR